MLVSNPERFVIIPNIDEGAKFVIAHEAKENISPKETSAITSNGTYHITPSSGFNAMREVEVDVRIEEKADPKLQSKEVLITTNNSNTNIVADEGFDGLGNVAIDVQIPTEERSVDITRNGEVEILPISTDAMTRVTANVQVPPPPLEEKQVTITKAKTTEIITPDVEYGLGRVEVITDIPLESKRVTITNNGVTTIKAGEGYEGIDSVDVDVEIEGGGEGFDLVKMFGKEPEFSKFINSGILESINYTETLLAQKKDATSWASAMKRVLYVDIPMNQVLNMSNAFQYNYSLLYLSDMNLENATNTSSAFRECRIPHLGYVNIPKATAASYMFLNCLVGEIESEVVVNFGWKKDTDTLCVAEGMFQNLKLNIDKLVIEGDRCKSFSSININAGSSINEFYALNSENCVNLSHISWNTSINRIFLGSVENCTTFANFSNRNVEVLQMSRWKQTNLSVNSLSLLPSSIHYIIQNAMSVADGATARTLTLNATAKKNWQNSEYYEQDLAVLTDKGITIA